jgi:hypothetical protein
MLLHTGEKGNAYKFFVGKPEGKEPLGRLWADGRIILNCILKKCDRQMWAGFTSCRVGASGRLF